MQRLLLIAFSLAIIAVTVSSFSGASMAADASPKTSAAPESSSADNPSLKEYKKLLENYYFLDKQKAEHISCNVSVPELQGLIDQLRKEYGSKLTIDENLHDFSVTYDRTKGLSFNLPHIKLSYPPDTKSVISENDANERINQVQGGITVPLREMISPPTKNFNILSLTKDGNDTVVSVDDAKKNIHYRATYSGSTLKGTIFLPPMLNKAWTIDYQPLSGKLAMAHLADEVTEGSRKSNTTYSISYQDLGSTFFPAQILADGTLLEGTQQLKSIHYETDFKDCKTSDLSP